MVYDIIYIYVYHIYLNSSCGCTYIIITRKGIKGQQCCPHAQVHTHVWVHRHRQDLWYGGAEYAHTPNFDHAPLIEDEVAGSARQFAE